MKRNPYLYDGSSVNEILNKPIRIEIGKINWENWKLGEVDEIIEGKFIKCNLASNYPHKPSDFIFQSLTGKISDISIGVIVSVEILKNQNDNQL